MKRIRAIAILVCLISCFWLAGCGRRSETQIRTYGYSAGAEGNRSINGYSVFRKMFQQRGDKTFTAVSYSKALDSMDTIVWTPDTVTPPGLSNRDTLEEWLKGKSGRTLVYIGRDFDASSDYWEHVVEAMPAGQKSRALREQMLSRVEAMENDLGGIHFARWFVVDTTPLRTPVQGLRGKWADGIDVTATKLATRTELHPALYWDEEKKNLPALLGEDAELSQRFWANSEFRWTPEEIDSISDDEIGKIPDAEILLEADDGRPLVYELNSIEWNNSKIIVIANGSFTLNGALVSKEHRKLAAKVIDACKPKGRVAFLRTGRNGVRMNDPNDSDYATKGLEMFAYWPMNFIVYQFFILGIILCFVVFPIFGRPRSLPPPELSDFGQHIEALGGMLSNCRDETFAREKLSEYFRLVRKEPNHPWCLPVAPKMMLPAKPATVFTDASTIIKDPIPIEAEIITAQIQETKN